MMQFLLGRLTYYLGIHNILDEIQNGRNYIQNALFNWTNRALTTKEHDFYHTLF